MMMLNRCTLVLFIISSLGSERIREDEQNKTSASCTGQNYTDDVQKSPICYCDSDCVFYGDCCDYTTNSSFVDFPFNPKPKCQRFGQQGYPSFWTVTSCPEGDSLMNDGISLPVMDDGISLPVLDENGKVFVSDQIAHCNNVSSFSLMDIHVILRREICDVDLIYSSLEKPFMDLFTAITISDCRFIINSKHDKRLTPRLCVDWSEEEMERNSFSSECKKYERPIKVPPVVYKNALCFEDLYGFPLPDNATEVKGVYLNNETSLRIQFSDSLREPSYKENRVCTENVMENCHRRLIKNWNQTIEVNLDAVGIMYENHLKYSTIFFLYNFLQNNVNLTLSDGIRVKLNEYASSKLQCITITMTVKSTGDVNVEELKRTMAFIETISLNPFTSEIKLLNGDSFTVVSAPQCKHYMNKDAPIKSTLALSFKLPYVLSIIRFLGLPKDVKTYCQNLYVWSDERINRKYVDVFIRTWQCIQEDVDDENNTEKNKLQTFWYILIAVCGIGFTCTIVIGVYFSSLKKPDDNFDSE